MSKLSYIKRGLAATAGGAIGRATIAYIPYAISECSELFSKADYKLFEYMPEIFSSLVYHFFIIFTGIFVSGVALYATFYGTKD